jgi:hypothetical protein
MPGSPLIGVRNSVFQSHSLPGQLLGEMGAVGIAAFLSLLFFLGFTLYKISNLGRAEDIRVDPFFLTLALACMMTLVLLLFNGIFGHNLYRYNWFFIGAFTTLIHFFLIESIKTQILKKEAK